MTIEDSLTAECSVSSCPTSLARRALYEVENNREGDAVSEAFRHHPEVKVTLIASTPPRRTSTLHLFAIVGSGQ